MAGFKFAFSPLKLGTRASVRHSLAWPYFFSMTVLNSCWANSFKRDRAWKILLLILIFCFPSFAPQNIIIICLIVYFIRVDYCFFTYPQHYIVICILILMFFSTHQNYTYLSSDRTYYIFWHEENILVDLLINVCKYNCTLQFLGGVLCRVWSHVVSSTSAHNYRRSNTVICVKRLA